MYAATEGKYTLLVLEDEDPLNPREDCEPFGKMVCWHRRYRLGDEHRYAEPLEFLQDMVMTLYKDKPRAVFAYVKHDGAKGVRLYSPVYHTVQLEYYVETDTSTLGPFPYEPADAERCLIMDMIEEKCRETEGCPCIELLLKEE